jgi:hypothetical protein
MKWCNSLPTFQIWKDEFTPRPSWENDGPILNVDGSTMTLTLTSMDLEIQCRTEGDDIIVYPQFKVTRVAGLKQEY